jgi:hypothetical protein
MIGVLGFGSRRGLGIFLFTTASRTVLGPIQTPIQLIPGALSLGVKRQGREADHSPSSSAGDQRMSGSIPPLPQYAFTAWCSVKAQGQLYLYISHISDSWISLADDSFWTGFIIRLNVFTVFVFIIVVLRHLNCEIFSEDFLGRFWFRYMIIYLCLSVFISRSVSSISRKRKAVLFSMIFVLLTYKTLSA